MTDHPTRAAELEPLSSVKSFGGELRRYSHNSHSTGTSMTFAIFLPPQSKQKNVPVLYWLSGLTCTDENFNQKAGAHALAAELGMAIVCPDTSPRGTELPDEHSSYDFGSGAGFYVNATQTPWQQHYRMYDYVSKELPELIAANFAVTDKAAISGHSMGGHGALICGLKAPDNYQSVSAFAPIANPSNCPWGKKAFSGYLGDNQALWQQWDACALVNQASKQLPILVDQGTADDFLVEQLKPEALTVAFEQAGYPLELRLQAGYDHSYYFIASFIKDHLRFHARALGLL